MPVAATLKSTTTSHTRAVIVMEVTLRRPSALKLAALTLPPRRIGSQTGLPLSASHLVRSGPKIR